MINRILITLGFFIPLIVCAQEVTLEHGIKEIEQFNSGTILFSDFTNHAESTIVELPFDIEWVNAKYNKVQWDGYTLGLQNTASDTTLRLMGNPDTGGEYSLSLDNTSMSHYILTGESPNRTLILTYTNIIFEEKPNQYWDLRYEISELNNSISIQYLDRQMGQNHPMLTLPHRIYVGEVETGMFDFISIYTLDGDPETPEQINGTEGLLTTVPEIGSYYTFSFPRTNDVQKLNETNSLQVIDRGQEVCISSGKKIETLSVYTYDGRFIRSQELNSNENCFSIPKGIYIINVELSNGQSIRRKILKF